MSIDDLLRKQMMDIVDKVNVIAVTVSFFMMLSFLLSLLIAFYTSRQILDPIKHAISIAESIANGNRDVEIIPGRNNETGQLIIALSIMRNAIKDSEVKKKQYANDILNACASMLSTLDEVREAVDKQSAGASEQASSINQITASISEIEKSATQTMNKAKDLGGVAEKTRESGQKGLESVEDSVVGMKAVRDKVQLIAQTILDLSRQTQQVGENYQCR